MESPASKIIQKESVAGTSAFTMIPAGADTPQQESRIELKKEGQTVQAMIVHCNCGQTHEIVCQYG